METAVLCGRKIRKKYSYVPMRNIDAYVLQG